MDDINDIRPSITMIERRYKFSRRRSVSRHNAHVLRAERRWCWAESIFYGSTVLLLLDLLRLATT